MPCRRSAVQLNVRFLHILLPAVLHVRDEEQDNAMEVTVSEILRRMLSFCSFLDAPRSLAVMSDTFCKVP